MYTGRRRQSDARDAEEVGGEGKMRIWGIEKGKNNQRMKAGAQKHQLKMTAAGKPDSTLSERGETMSEDGKGKNNR